MAEVLPDRSGGIASLFALPDDVWEAIEADLARVGLSLDDCPQRLSWRAVFAMVRHSRPEDARHQALLELSEQNEKARAADEIRQSIAAAMAGGLA